MKSHSDLGLEKPKCICPAFTRIPWLLVRFMISPFTLYFILRPGQRSVLYRCANGWAPHNLDSGKKTSLYINGITGSVVIDFFGAVIL